MKKFIVENKIFILLYLLFFIGGGIIIATSEKGNEILYFSSLHTPAFDGLFKWITRLAEAPVLLLIILIAIRFGYGKGLLLGLNCLLVFATVQLLKYVIFPSQDRPSAFFEGKTQLNFAQGMEVLRYNSFPSGHTATAFALFFMLSILIKNKRWSVLFFACALLVGISRVYLLQHFFRDVYFGAFTGMCLTAFFYLIFEQSGYYQNLGWKDKALFK